MTAIQSRNPNPRETPIRFLIDGGDRIRRPFPIRRDLRSARILEREVIFSSNAAALRHRQAGERKEQDESSHRKMIAPVAHAKETDVAHALLRAASTLLSTPFPAQTRCREESRHGTHECVRHRC